MLRFKLRSMVQIRGRKTQTAISDSLAQIGLKQKSAARFGPKRRNIERKPKGAKREISVLLTSRSQSIVIRSCLLSHHPTLRQREYLFILKQL
jgi:hypothetical protein